MPKRLLKRFMPEHHVIREHKHLRWLGAHLHDPNLWHLNRKSVPGAFSVGLFMAFVPVPFQMVLAAIAAITVRVNLPISVALVWITNPLTMGPIFYLAYKVGSLALGQVPQDIEFAFTMEWMTSQLEDIWAPFLLGCLIFSSLASLTGNLLIRSLWRLQVRKNWRLRVEARRKRRRNTQQNSESGP